MKNNLEHFLGTTHGGEKSEGACETAWNTLGSNCCIEGSAAALYMRIACCQPAHPLWHPRHLHPARHSAGNGQGIGMETALLGSGRNTVRKILVSVKFVSAILGPEMGAPILWTPGKNAFFLQEKPCP